MTPFDVSAAQWLRPPTLEAQTTVAAPGGTAGSAAIASADPRTDRPASSKMGRVLPARRRFTCRGRDLLDADHHGVGVGDLDAIPRLELLQEALVFDQEA